MDGTILAYDGIPRWLVDKFDVPTDHPFPWPFVDSHFKDWMCGYFTEECGSGFQQLYENKAGAADKMAAVWALLAETYKGNNAVLGYELINEPWAGDIYEDITRLLPANAGSKNLVPFYENITAAMRAVNDEAVIFWEPVTWSYFIPTLPDPIIDLFLESLIAAEGMNLIKTVMPMLCGELQPNATEILTEMVENLAAAAEQSVLSPGFAEVPGGPEYNDRSVMSWHYYCWLIKYANGNDNYDPFLQGICDNAFSTVVAYTSEERNKQIGGGRMFTEFGRCHVNVTNPDGMAYIECAHTMAEAEKHFASWTFWDHNFWDAEGNADLLHIKLFSRPYPRATSGTPYKLEFDPDTQIFTYMYTPDTTMEVPTEIFVPPLWYKPGEYVIHTSPDLSYTVDETNPSILYVTATSSDTEYSFFQITPFQVNKDEL